MILFRVSQLSKYLISIAPHGGEYRDFDTLTNVFMFMDILRDEKQPFSYLGVFLKLAERIISWNLCLTGEMSTNLGFHIHEFLI
jgi:hypothetical protein